MNPFWLGGAKTVASMRAPRAGLSPATAGAFDDAGGAAATSPAVAASQRRLPRLGAAHHSSAKRTRDRRLSAADTNSPSPLRPQQPAKGVVETRSALADETGVYTPTELFTTDAES